MPERGIVRVGTEEKGLGSQEIIGDQEEVKFMDMMGVEDGEGLQG